MWFIILDNIRYKVPHRIALDALGGEAIGAMVAGIMPHAWCINKTNYIHKSLNAYVLESIYATECLRAKFTFDMIIYGDDGRYYNVYPLLCDEAVGCFEVPTG